MLLNVGDRVEVSCRESEDGATLREAESVTVLGGEPLPELPVTPDVPADTGAETGEGEMCIRDRVKESQTIGY